ncbi:MAG: WbqC family protein [Saprospiraceae bacterium]|nr:WbqC family protein [Saprospiraceae bacterium]
MVAPSKQKIVAIHQPNYFPWLGYFYKIAACDVFVFHDNVEHSKRYPTRRTLIRKSAEDIAPIWLTVPLKSIVTLHSLRIWKLPPIWNGEIGTCGL